MRRWSGKERKIEGEEGGVRFVSFLG